MLRNSYSNWRRPPLAVVLLILGAIVLGTFIYMTFEWDMYLVNVPEYEWDSGSIGITAYRILGTDDENDQITVKNNHKFTILVKELTVGETDLVEEKQQLLAPGQAVTFMGKIGSGEVGGRFELEILMRYDDEDNQIAGYEFAPKQKLTGIFE